MAKEYKILYDKINPKYYTVLGLDCSSSTIGWGITSIENNNICLLGNGYFKPLGSKNPELMRLQNTWKYIIDLCQTFNPNCVSVEDILLFMKGKSQAKTITILTAFNRVASLAAYQITNNVSFYSVRQVRSMIKNYYSIKDVIQKKDMPNIIRNFLSPKFSDIINKKGSISIETYDEADGIAVSWAKALHTLNPDLLKPKIKRKRKK